MKPFRRNPTPDMFEDRTSYLYDSINTRVPPMNISGKKPLLSGRNHWESPQVVAHSKSNSVLPKEPVFVRRESPQPSYRSFYRLEKPVHDVEQAVPSVIRERYMAQPIVMDVAPIYRPTSYRPALGILNNPQPRYVPPRNLNPFEVVERLFEEDRWNRSMKERKASPESENSTREQKVEKGTDPIEFSMAKEGKIPVLEEEKEKNSNKNQVEVIPTVPNEDKSDPNIKIASYVVSPIQKKSPSKFELFPTKGDPNQSGFVRKHTSIHRKIFEEKRKFLKALIEEIDATLQKHREIDEIRAKDLQSLLR